MLTDVKENHEEEFKLKLILLSLDRESQTDRGCSSTKAWGQSSDTSEELEQRDFLYRNIGRYVADQQFVVD